jgi:hypothetical protein
MKTKTERRKKAVPKPLSCPHCHVEHNSRGAPFTQQSLLLHILKSHPDLASEANEEMPANALQCDVCGAWKSRRGGVFVTEADLRRHMSISHPGERSSHGNAGSPPAVAANGKVRSRPSSVQQSVKFCPQCGCNLDVVAAALSFVQ